MITETTGRWNWIGTKDRCWRCGGRFGHEIEIGAMVIHHLIPKSESNDWDTDDNRSLLCGNCHNVIHNRKMGTLGRSQTRNGEWRKLTNIASVIKISHNEPSATHSLGDCPNCGHRGKVVGVLEEWFGCMGMVILLDCSSCGLHFGVPFIGKG